MRARGRTTGSVGATVALGIGLLSGSGPLGTPAWAQFTTNFRLEDCDFSARGGNTYFRLDPGHTVRLEGLDDGEAVVVQITVLRQTRPVTFTTPSGATLTVRTRVVEEREWVDGELVEVSRNFVARCRPTSDVYYFGEEVDIYEDGEVVSHDGAWLAGQDGAQPGLIMPGTFLLGARYYQEIAPGVAEDRAEHVAMELALDLPAGSFTGCVEVWETSPLDAGVSVKRYCPGVGLVFDDGVELIEVNGAPDNQLDEDERSGRLGLTQSGRRGP